MEPSRKFFISQFEKFEKEGNKWRYSQILFQRVWVQGLIIDVEDPHYFVIDDGTGCIGVITKNMKEPKPTQKKRGMYVLVLGTISVNENEQNGQEGQHNGQQSGQQSFPTINCHKFSDLSDEWRDRETFWLLDVVLLQKRFYL